MKISKTIFPLILPGLLIISFGCKNVDPSGTAASLKVEQANELVSDILPTCISECLLSLPYEDISIAEENHLLLMREEELMAGEVYEYFYSLYPVPVFNNISKSERVHTLSIKVLLDKYKLPDPARDHIRGVFSNQEIQQLYDTLTASGSQSLEDALIMAETIEDLDIADLQKCLQDIDNEDIRLVFENLSKGSRNHMRAFYSHLDKRAIVYEPKHISQSEYEAIINAPWERGNGICMDCTQPDANKK